MIDFSPTEEQIAFQRVAHKFAEEVIRPAAAEADETESVPWEVIEKAHQAGLLTFAFPEKYGGGGVNSVLTKAIVDEEIFWGCAGIGTLMGGVALAATPILLAGSEAQKDKYLTRLCDPGQVVLGAYALTEPGAGSDPGSMATTARRVGDHYVLNGQKVFITNAGLADIYIVFATVDVARGTEGVTAFILEKDWKGVRPGKKERKMGIRASHTAALFLEEVEVPLENRLGAEGGGFKIAMRTFDITRSHIAAGAIGLARAAYDYALQYAHDRRQFGRPIFSFQSIAFNLADLAMQIDAARLLTWRAAWLYDQGRPCAAEASMAKAFAADVAMKATTDAVQILGGYGYMRDYPVEKWMRDAKIMQIYEGTAQIQRVVISRRLKP